MADLPSVYLITDRHQIPAGRDFLEILDELLVAGIRLIQLREKDLTAAELLPLAIALRESTRRYDCKLLINDRIDVALAIEADGVHLGGHSLPAAAARRLLGPDKLIGVSTHSLQDVTAATEQGADFVTFGPVFHTPSKAAYGLPVGLDKLRQACAESRIPVYALGGIKPDNATQIKSTKAHGIAMISALLAAQSPESSYQKFLERLSC